MKSVQVKFASRGKSRGNTNSDGARERGWARLDSMNNAARLQPCPHLAYHGAAVLREHPLHLPHLQILLFFLKTLSNFPLRIFTAEKLQLLQSLFGRMNSDCCGRGCHGRAPLLQSPFLPFIHKISLVQSTEFFPCAESSRFQMHTIEHAIRLAILELPECFSRTACP